MLTQVVGGRPGPVLAGFGDACTGFFVPPGTVDRRLGTGVRAARCGTWIVVSYPGGPALGQIRRLVPPDGSGPLTDPALLERADARGGGPGRGRGRGGVTTCQRS